MNEAESRSSGGQIGIAVVDCNATRQRQRDALAVSRKSPLEHLVGLGREVVDALVPREIARMLRDAEAREIGWRSAGDELQRSDATGNERRVNEVAAAHHTVHPFFYQVHHAVAAAHLEPNVRIARKELW